MKYLKLTKWESNVIQVGLDHIKDEFEFLTDKQYSIAQTIVNDLTIYIEKNPKEYTPKEMKKFMEGFGLYHYEKVLVTMAITEIYIMHLDLLGDELDVEEIKFSKDVISACKSIFNKLMMGVK